MTLSRLNTLLLIFSLCFASLLDVRIQASPYSLDESTLLLAGFDEDPERADYANGWDRFGGGGYSVVEGYYGNGVDLRGIELPQDFWSKDNAFLPHYSQWVFWPRGNIDFRQGTMEFWFKVAPDDARRTSIGGSDLIHFQSHQPLRTGVTDDYVPAGLPPREEIRRAQSMGKHLSSHIFVRLNTRQLSWSLVSLKGQRMKGSVTFAREKAFGRNLSPDQWHHFAIQWSAAGVEIYLDGRLVGVHSLQNDAGLALTSPTQRGLAINGVVMDELRISRVPRYRGGFEPNWRESSRPADAFPGVSGLRSIEHGPLKVAEIPLTLELPQVLRAQDVRLGDWVLQMNQETGYIKSLQKNGLQIDAKGSAAGLLIWQGVERTPLHAVTTSAIHTDQPDQVLFEQQWPHGLKVEHHLTTGVNGALFWKVAFEHQGSDKLWIEPLLAVPVPETSTEFFDMSWVQTKLDYPRRRNEYVFSLPMTAAFFAGNGLGVGMNPRNSASALIGEWLPELNVGSRQNQAMIRQGTRLALAPGERHELEFVVFDYQGKFGVRDGVAAYHALFPDLYYQNPAIPVYNYLGVSQHFPYVHIPDLSRLYYVGGQWGHGPYHTKGDYLGSPQYWGREDLKDRIDYQHGLRHQRSYKTIESLRQAVVDRSREAFNNFYTIRRSHDLPNSTATYIVEDLMPGIEFEDDPLTRGQYYYPNNTYANEYRTPLGDKFKEDQANTMRLIGRYSPGFINDASQASSYRFTDVYARSTPGRAFSEDRGEYLISAFGHVDRYKMINGFRDNGYQQSIWSDFGMVSYMLSAYSAGNAFESGDPFVSTPSMVLGLQVSRNLLGEKPIGILTSYGLDNIGSVFRPDDFTPEQLRDYYRYAYRRLMLTAMETGFYADPPLLHGKQWNSEMNPVLVESLVYGRKTLAGVQVESPLWVIRGGEGAQMVVAVGNSSASLQTGTALFLHDYFRPSSSLGEKDISQPVWAPYFGGTLKQEITIEGNRISDIEIAAHDVVSFKPVAQLRGAGEGSTVIATWRGDGLVIYVDLDIELTTVAKVRPLLPMAYYKLSRLLVNDRSLSLDIAGEVALSKGKHRLRVELTNTVLDFTPEQWDQVELIQNGQPNFCVIGTTRPGYEHGTASQLNWFLQQYDEEDGIVGNLAEARIYESEEEIPADFNGWKLDVRPAGFMEPTRVIVDSENKNIRFMGRTSGEVRRAKMLFMRLVDRRYPRIGRNVPMDGNLRRGWQSPGWDATGDHAGQPGWHRLYGTRRPQTKAFFEAFSDPDFLIKPILERESEPLYANGNQNFEGRYTLRFSPYLFEPTYEDDYVYGYSGPRWDETPEELKKVSR